MPAPSPSRRLVPDPRVRSRHNGRKGLTLLVLPALAAACAMPVAGTDSASAAVAPEIYELANMRDANIVPKSSATSLVATFEKYCLNGSHDPAHVASALRSADFVAVPKAPQATITAFAVDDARPLVMVSDDGRTCAVAAASRTGQTARIHGMIAQRFPAATALDPAQVSPRTELAVQVAGANSGVIFVQRLAPTIANSRLILGIMRDG